jgi:hypothetical protein
MGKIVSFRPIVQWPAIVRAVVFLVGVVLLWLPIALPFYWLSARGRLPGGDLIPTALLYLFFLALLPRWERYVHRIRRPWKYIGLTGRFSVFFPLVQGLGIGLASIGTLAAIQMGLGWAEAVPSDRGWLGLVAAGSLTALAVGWAEELLFRGWLLRELEQGWSAFAALVMTSLIFAVAHFIKPLEVILATLPQFLGLLLLGFVLGWARRITVVDSNGQVTTSLGFPIGLHSGLVWGYYILNVGEILRPTSTVPEWVTGLDGNPLAGLLGLVLLMGLGAWFYRWSRTNERDATPPEVHGLR